ncbi:MAG: hypothetical protein J3K34DRAFT_178887 [Monoraphidium minutum]|nr:MAG: hypothetical protein J3K34DRAFT_178887 [Monoraphidium minutum]
MCTTRQRSSSSAGPRSRCRAQRWRAARAAAAQSQPPRRMRTTTCLQATMKRPQPSRRRQQRCRRQLRRRRRRRRRRLRRRQRLQPPRRRPRRRPRRLRRPPRTATTRGQSRSCGGSCRSAGRTRRASWRRATWWRACGPWPQGDRRGPDVRSDGPPRAGRRARAVPALSNGEHLACVMPHGPMAAPAGKKDRVIHARARPRCRSASRRPPSRQIAPRGRQLRFASRCACLRANITQGLSVAAQAASIRPGALSQPRSSPRSVHNLAHWA